MTVTILGVPLNLGSLTGQAGSDAKAGSAAFAEVFQAASNQARRSADLSILDSARRGNSVNGETPATAIGPRDLRREADASLGDLNHRLQQLFADADVDTSIDIQLVGDGAGGVQVTGAHPDEEKINEILAEHPQLAQQFHDLLAQFSKLQANSPSLLGPAQSGMLSMIISGQKARMAFDPVQGVEN